jgi:hypothetical protein
MTIDELLGKDIEDKMRLERRIASQLIIKA